MSTPEEPAEYPGKTLDVEAEVSISNEATRWRRSGQMVLAGRLPAASFSPPAAPEMRGRRPSGKVFSASEVSEEMRGVPIHDDPPFACSKRVAKGVAEELTRRPVQVRERNGMCQIEVVFPLQRLAFHGRTWFLALGNLKDFLDKRHAFR